MESKRVLWDPHSVSKKYPALQKDIVADVAIIGGGITGISTGLLLAQRGLNVAVLESHGTGWGNSSDSTGNLYFTTDSLLSSIEEKYDTEAVKKVANSRIQALEKIETWVKEFSLDCDYKDIPMYLYSNYEKGHERIEKEFQTGRNSELPFLKTNSDEIPYPHKNGLKILHQNQINPLQYVQELARAAHGYNCSIYEQTHVERVESKENRFVLHAEDVKVEAEYVVHATHTPKGVKMVQTLLGPYREYGIACTLNNQEIPEGIFWGYHEDGKKISTRLYKKNGNRYLIVVGEPHKTGQSSENKQHIENLENFAKKFFDIRNVEYRWGGQHYRPADLLPYIGPGKKDSREYIATGYSTDGLVYGTLAGMIISDQITGQENKWSEFYSANRHQPLKSAAKFIKENVNVAGQMVKDYASTTVKSENFDTADIQIGEGRIIKYNGKKLAVFRNKNNELEAVSPVCTHMKCIVHWNDAEESWDCPCHGSRFKTDGTVLEGPAYDPLDKVDL